jgi:alkaline phosphatase D
VDRVRFAVAGCQHYEQGLFTAYRRLAEEDLDFVFCYGDYIYEGRGARLYNSPRGPTANPRSYVDGEIYSLDDYRRRYAQSKMDPDLQAAHAAAAWFSVWDDHEIDNNWVSDLDQDGTPPAIFKLRQQSAMQAFYENTPLRPSALPTARRCSCSAGRLRRLLELNFLDTRQYRSDQPCEDRWNTVCADIDQARAEVLGARQERWLLDGLAASKTRWKALAQQIMVMDLDRNPGEPYTANLDSWGGYRTPRARLLGHIRDRRSATSWCSRATSTRTMRANCTWTAATPARGRSRPSSSPPPSAQAETARTSAAIWSPSRRPIRS